MKNNSKQTQSCPVRDKVYFTADVHLGLEIGDPGERESRFVSWLRDIKSDAKALYLLGDIWDFWYEYRTVIPKEGIRVVATLIELMDSGVEVYFMPGNHDIWTYSFFESIGIRKIRQPYWTEIGGRKFCLAHGDGLYEPRRSYRFMLKVFNSRFCQALFSAIHPTLAFKMATGWSTKNRISHTPYIWKGEDEPLVKFAVAQVEEGRPADYFIFGHYHIRVHQSLPCGGELFVTDSWMDGGMPCLVFDGESVRAER